MDIGDTLGFRSDVRDPAGVLVNAQTATLTVTLPDGSTATPTVANPVAGKYAGDYVTTLASPTGRYVGQWLFTFSGGSTTSYVESFDVGAGLVTVDEARSHLRANGVITSADDLEQLQWLCLVATDAVERDLGRVLVRRTVTETYDGSGGAIILRHTPVVSVTSVVESGVTLTGSDYLLNSSVGILYRGSTAYYRSFAYGFGNVVVTYVAGYTDPPRAARAVALNLVQSMWQQSQQAFHPGLDESAELGVSSAVAGLPDPLRRAYDSLRIPGLA